MYALPQKSREPRARDTEILNFGGTKEAVTNYYVPSPTTVIPRTRTQALHVNGNRIVDASGNTVYLRGWNHESGVETDTFKWSSWAYFDQSSVQKTLDAYASNGANVLRRHLVMKSWIDNINCNTAQGTWTYKQCWDYILTEAEKRGIYVIIDIAKVTQWTSGTNDQMGFAP